MPISVLLVEDEPDLARVVALALQRAGHQVVVADTGAHAVEIIRSAHVDVVVADRGLPDMDGTDAVAQMRALGYAGAVLVTSGYAGEEHEAVSRAAGADRVLSKPFKLAELVDQVRELASGQELVA